MRRFFCFLGDDDSNPSAATISCWCNLLAIMYRRLLYMRTLSFSSPIISSFASCEALRFFFCVRVNKQTHEVFHASC
jgi:hypothetical protein